MKNNPRRQFLKNTALGLAALASPNSCFGATQTSVSNRVSKIPKTDTHVHLFDLARFKYSWLKNAPDINRSFSVDDFRNATKKSNITKILFMESGADIQFNVQEAQRVSELAMQESRIKGIIAKLDLAQGEKSQQELDDLSRLPLLRGLRGPFPQKEDDPQAFLQGLDWLQSKQLTFDLLLTPERLLPAANIVEQSPNNVFILDHLGNPAVATGKKEIWQDGINALAALPNVNCKISGIITRAGKGWKRREIEPYLHYVIERFGMDRLVYGGDWPVVLRAGSYHSWSRAFEKITRKFDVQDLEKMYHENADRIYRLI